MTRHTFSQDDFQLSCYETGSGQPLVLLHGFPLDHRMWSPQIAALKDCCHVIAPDLRGFGQSTLAADDADNGVEMSRYAADVLTVLDRIGTSESVILCGFSMGGYVLWQFLKQFPERVRAVILCDTKATEDSAAVRVTRLQVAEVVVQQGTGPLVEAMLPKLLAPATLSNRKEVAEEVEAMIRGTNPDAVAAAQRGMARREDVTAELSQFEIPALVIAGAEDQISPPQEMRAIAQALPQAEFVEVPQAGHMTTLENPRAVNDALRSFLATLSVVAGTPIES